MAASSASAPRSASPPAVSTPVAPSPSKGSPPTNGSCAGQDRLGLEADVYKVYIRGMSMGKTAVITTRVDAETAALVDQVARASGKSRARFAAEAIRRAAKEEAEFLAFVQEGIDDLDAGRTVPHEQVMAMLDGWVDEYEAKCRD